MRPLSHKFIQLDVSPSNKQYCSCKTKRKSMQDKTKACKDIDHALQVNKSGALIVKVIGVRVEVGDGDVLRDSGGHDGSGGIAQ